MVEIWNGTDARLWLETQDRQVQMWFACRCALRGVAALGHWSDAAKSGSAFAAFRSIFIAVAASKTSVPQIKARAQAALLRMGANSSQMPHPPGARSAIWATKWALQSVTETSKTPSGTLEAAEKAAINSVDAVEFTVDPLAYTENSSDSSEVFGNMVYAAIALDANSPMQWRALWDRTEQPEVLIRGWSALKQKFQDTGDDWSFWIEWYEAILKGTPLPWELTRRIAFDVTDNDWAAGQAVVGRRIAEIRDDWLSEQLPQAEDLSEDPATGRFDVRAVSFEKENLIESILSRIEFSLSLAVDSNSSDFNRMCTAFKYLDHTLTNCRDDPNAIEQNVGLAKGIIENNLSDPTYRADNGLKALAQSLDQHQLQIRADHPEVRKAWEKRIAQKIREVDRDIKLKAAEAIRAEQSRIQGRLSIETDLDAETVETEQPAEVQATAIRRATGRSAKMNILQRASQTAKDIDASGGYKATRIGTTGYTLVDFVLKILGG